MKRHSFNILEFLVRLRLGILFLCCFLPVTWTYGQAKSADETLKTLTLNEKIGQLLIFGYSGMTAEGSLKSAIRTYNPGALITFGRNISSLEQIARVNEKAQSWAKEKKGVPLFIMVDQEGGNVSRLRIQPGLPSALALGATKDFDLVENYGAALGQFMNQLGFNMNLAPVLDLSDPQKLSFIGPRSFGSQPEYVGQMAGAFAKGLAKGGVIPTAKHFPGHGGVTQDSHHVTPQKLATLSELFGGDLVPFNHFAHADFPRAVMMAHISYPQIDASGTPAAFSEIFIQTILRQKLKYDGLIITDDVEMSGANVAGSIEERVVRAVEAGNDMVMIAWSPKRQARAFQALVNAAKAGRLTEARIDESVKRILTYKKQMHIGTSTPLKQLKVNLQALSEKVKRFNFLASANPQKKLRGLMMNHEPITVFASDPKFFTQFKKQYGHDAKFVPLNPESKDQLEQQLLANDGIAVYYASGIKTARWLNQLTSDVKHRLIVVNTNQAGAVENRQNFLGFFQMNTLAPECGKWLADYLTSTNLTKPFKSAQFATFD